MARLAPTSAEPASSDAFRATRDLDLLGRGDASPSFAEAVFKELCRLAVEPDDVEFDAATVS
jgi:hypothetical protein